MSAWPNFAFDLCGMCCGHFKMDFWTFISATILGKAFTLRTIQAGQTQIITHTRARTHTDTPFVLLFLRRKSGFEMCFVPSTLGAAGPNSSTCRIQHKEV